MIYYIRASLIYSSFLKWVRFKIQYMSHFSYACKTEGENGIYRLISETA